MKSKKLIDKKPTCAGMIKLVLKDYDWLSKEELKGEVDTVNKKYTGVITVREDTFTKSINDLLNKKEIALRKTLESENLLEYNPSKDKKKYYFKLTSNFSYNSSKNIDVGGTLNLLKEMFTTKKLKENKITKLENRFIDKLQFEIEGLGLYASEQGFIIDVYKLSSPDSSYTFYKELNKFSLDCCYKDVTSTFKDNLKDNVDILNCVNNYQYRVYHITSGGVKYIEEKFRAGTGYFESIFLHHNLVIVIYVPNFYGLYEKSNYLISGWIFSNMIFQ